MCHIVINTSRLQCSEGLLLLDLSAVLLPLPWESNGTQKIRCIIVRVSPRLVGLLPSASQRGGLFTKLRVHFLSVQVTHLPYFPLSFYNGMFQNCTKHPRHPLPRVSDFSDPSLTAVFTVCPGIPTELLSLAGDFWTEAGISFPFSVVPTSSS